MKLCNTCEKLKPLDDFHKSKATLDGYAYKCKSCMSEYWATYKRKRRDPQKVRAYELKRKYGITQEQYDKMLDEQDGKCAVCGRPASDFQRVLAIDHDHRCCKGSISCGKCVRGLLCFPCNTHLGRIESGSVTLEQLMGYTSKFAIT